MESIWEATAQMPTFEPLAEDAKTDVLIIGGGMAGVLLAYELEQAGVPYLLVERNRIGSGTTGGTTGKVTVQHGLLYDRLLRKSEVLAEQYLAANEDALRTFRKLAKRIDCDWEERDNFIYSIDDEEALCDELSALKKLGADADWCSAPRIPLKTVGAVRMHGQAQFHPLRFLAGIASGLQIREKTRVRALDGRTALTDGGRIRAERVVLASHFPFWDRHGLYWMKLYQSRSYLLALEDAPAPDGMYMDEDPTGFTFRAYRQYVLLGGGAHRVGKRAEGFDAPRDLAEGVYPEASERFAWAAQDCMSLDGVPYIGQYAKRTPNAYVATGFNKWGMTGAMAAAKLLAGQLIGHTPDWAEAFSPARSMLHPQLVVNGFESACGLLTPTTPRCPHMGCALHKNNAEQSWDCACHGSRFALDGTLLDNPATGDLPNVPDPAPDDLDLLRKDVEKSKD